MPESGADLGLIAARLSDIKSLLVAILALTIVTAGLGILRFGSASLKNLL
jgi:hypothetical protein